RAHRVDLVVRQPERREARPEEVRQRLERRVDERRRKLFAPDLEQKCEAHGTPVYQELCCASWRRSRRPFHGVAGAVLGSITRSLRLGCTSRRPSGFCSVSARRRIRRASTITARAARWCFGRPTSARSSKNSDWRDLAVATPPCPLE